MFDKKYEERLALWKQFRDTLEVSEDPIQDAIEFYRYAPTTNFSTDPYTPSMWPDPWEQLEENQYCTFGKILAICYSLQLTDYFSTTTFEIHIKQDQEKSRTLFLLFVGDRVIGYNGDTHVHRDELPNRLYSQLEHVMQSLQ
jgi:hypothetical protein